MSMAFSYRAYNDLHGVEDETLDHHRPAVRNPLPARRDQRRVVIAQLFEETYETGWGYKTAVFKLNAKLLDMACAQVPDGESVDDYFQGIDIYLDYIDRSFVSELVTVWEADPRNH